MSSFIDRIRSGAGKAAFEADKLRRMNAVQSEIKGLKGEVRQALNRVGDVAYDLYREGRLEQPVLQKSCQGVQALEERIATAEQQLESIRQEEYVEDHYGRVCPNGHGPIPPENSFCQECGARAVEAAPPAAANRSCQNCGQELSAEARFCANCGAPAPPPEAEATPAFCRECGTQLLPEAIFCSECGASAPDSEQAPSPEPSEWSAAPSEAESEAAVGADVSEATPAEESEDGAPSWEPTEEAEATEAPVNATEGEPAPEAPAEANRCPSCDAPLLPEAVFCAECGRQLEGA